MREEQMTCERKYCPDEGTMVDALMTILRATGPPGQTQIKETVSNSLQAPLTVSTHTTRPDTGGSRV